MIKKADVTHANKRFTSISHDYCLIFKEQSEFDAVKTTVNEKLGGDKFNTCNQRLNIVPLNSILEGNSSFTVEVIGITMQDGLRENINVQHSLHKEAIKGRLQL